MMLSHVSRLSQCRKNIILNPKKRFLSNRSFSRTSIFLGANDGNGEGIGDITKSSNSLEEIINQNPTTFDTMAEYGRENYVQKVLIDKPEIFNGSTDEFISTYLYQSIKSGDLSAFKLPILLPQYLMETLQYYTGFDWWVCIILIGVLLRISLFPLFLKQMRTSERMQQVQPEVQSIMKAMRNNPAKQREYSLQIKELYEKHDCSPFSSLRTLILQMPLFILIFFAVRDMCFFWPEMQTGGISFFTDLSGKDPYLRLPILSTLASLLIFETSAKTNPQQNMGNKVKWAIRIFSVLFLLIAMRFPMGVHLYWIVTGLMSAGFSLAFLRPSVRTYFGMRPLGQKKYENKYVKTKLKK